MGKFKTHKGISKRFRTTNPKSGKGKLVHQSKGRGTKHLKTKQSNAQRRRIRQPRFYSPSKVSSKIFNTIKK